MIVFSITKEDKRMVSAHQTEERTWLAVFAPIDFLTCIAAQPAEQRTCVPHTTKTIGWQAQQRTGEPMGCGCVCSAQVKGVSVGTGERRPIGGLKSTRGWRAKGGVKKRKILNVYTPMNENQFRFEKEKRTETLRRWVDDWWPGTGKGAARQKNKRANENENDDVEDVD
ncbi:hypothetical protein V9T40_014553 [Parthenolecanium corni]|uniref:Uncharacterized protein n=1 Tax=Parthenolecanium corni TaxID=536013 RepID=A0AAN9XYI9_9HEMI